MTDPGSTPPTIADPHSAPTLRTLLADVAAGRLAPDLAAAVLTHGVPVAPPQTASRASGGSTDGQPVRIEIELDAVELTVVGDPTIERIAVNGPLDVVERPDGVIALRLPTRSDDGNAYRFGATGGLLVGWLQGRNSLRATVRVHPDVPVSIAVNASKVSVEGLRGGLNLRAAACAVRLDDVGGPVAIDLQSSSAKGSMLLAEGASTVRGLMSSLDVALLRGSDVAVTIESEMGGAKVNGRKVSSTSTGERADGVAGSGTGTLEVRMTMSAAKVALP